MAKKIPNPCQIEGCWRARGWTIRMDRKPTRAQKIPGGRWCRKHAHELAHGIDQRDQRRAAAAKGGAA